MKYWILAGFLSLSTNVFAVDDDFLNAIEGLCEKTKSCAVANMPKQNLTPQQQAMMDKMLNGMCSNLKQQYGMQLADRKVYSDAVACIESMSNLSCGQLKKSRKNETAECKAFRQRIGSRY